MSKKQIATGFNGLLTPTTTEAEPKAAPETPETGTIKYKTVCYALSPEVIEAMRYIAYFDRKKINAVVTEAFNEYIERWNNKDHKIEKPKKI